MEFDAYWNLARGACGVKFLCGPDGVLWNILLIVMIFCKVTSGRFGFFPLQKFGWLDH